MRKILILIVLLLLVGCNTEENERQQEVKEYQQVLLDLMRKFDVQYEDTEWETPEYRTVGYGSYVQYGAEGINLVFLEDEEYVFMEVTFESSTRSQVSIEFIDLYYVSYKDNVYINIELYHPSTSWSQNYLAERVNINYIELARILTTFTMDEFKYLFHELGYVEVNYGG